jgi:hypothetical protein
MAALTFLEQLLKHRWLLACMQARILVSTSICIVHDLVLLSAVSCVAATGRWGMAVIMSTMLLLLLVCRGSMVRAPTSKEGLSLRHDSGHGVHQSASRDRQADVKGVKWRMSCLEWLQSLFESIAVALRAWNAWSPKPNPFGTTAC